jgi:hypothetical protein
METGSTVPHAGQHGAPKPFPPIVERIKVEGLEDCVRDRPRVIGQVSR